ncbi:hypothetical protein FT643_13600 [Ketobacter sp. MCCC 1A13808]|uniref:DUF6311 domain-containing protein n=1 Tax=Ketobacter sp. MCCC 1A13808 TaxID=2602738 RepID=UPI0012EC6C9A|nr:DUF6311 domain-containing protein [Ketobacter sp. MCCC 1A13808]MVF13171.1 hypothetical protein [Ketobacter sp. MCCC 1A13808]
MKFNSHKARGHWPVSLFSIAVGLLAFLAVVGPRALYPSNIAWLSAGDPAFHYLGWLFFRNSDWQFPIGLNPSYGLEISNAIIFSDSNPLFAIFFKMFSGFLPETFQYFGFWLLVCFILQTFFAYKLIGLISKNALLCAFGACCYVFSPPMLWRLNGHFSLVGHFLIVASLYLTFKPSLQYRITVWALLLSVSGFTHAYLLAMVGVVWIADLLDRYRQRGIPLNMAILEVAVVIGFVLLASWQAGYFSVGGDIVSGGFGYYRMHPLSILDASGWSYFVPDIPEAPGTYEGFNYLGLGMVLLGACSLPAALASRFEIIRSILKRPALLALLLLLTLFALSHQVGMQSLWFSLPLPEPVQRFANIFRSSGRMFWPVYYVVYFAIIFLIVRGYSRRVAIALIGLGLAVQIVDTSAEWLEIRKRLMTIPGSHWQTKLVNPFWKEAAMRYNRIRWIPPEENSVNWQELANFAGVHKMPTDAVHMARVDMESLHLANEKAIETLMTGQYDRDSLYFFGDNAIEKVARHLNSDSDLFARIDGFVVVAPGWNKCASCSSVPEELDAK